MEDPEVMRGRRKEGRKGGRRFGREQSDRVRRAQ